MITLAAFFVGFVLGFITLGFSCGHLIRLEYERAQMANTNAQNEYVKAMATVQTLGHLQQMQQTFEHIEIRH